MKKSILSTRFLFRAVLVIMGLALITFACISAMYARYSNQSDNDTPQASVSKWELNIEVDGSSMFSEYYAGGVIASPGSANDEYDVRADASSTVMTPDTSGELTVRVTGSAEVDARIILDATCVSPNVKYNDGVNNVTYEPVLWTLDRIVDGVETNLLTNGTAAQLVSAVDSSNYTVKAGTDSEIVYRIRWQWPLETGATPAEKTKNNELDSILAASMAGYSVDAKYTVTATVSFDITATLEQVN